MHDIDFWSLDVEGAELQVLQTVDFSRTNIKSMVCLCPDRSPQPLRPPCCSSRRRRHRLTAPVCLCAGDRGGWA